MQTFRLPLRREPLTQRLPWLLPIAALAALAMLVLACILSDPGIAPRL
jgi:hypothetical protein